MTGVEPTVLRPRLSGLAVVALLLGLVPVVGLALGDYLLLVVALPAVLVGYIALYRVNAGGGRLRGRALALGGMGLGGAGCLLGVLWLGALGYGWMKAKSQRATCADNLRRLGEGIQIYHDSHGKTYPQATLAADLPPEQRLSWLAGMLPDLDRRKDGSSRWQEVYDRLDPKVPWNVDPNRRERDVIVPRFLCPAHPDFNPEAHPGLTHYVGLAGLGGNAAALPQGDPRAGFFGYERILTSTTLQDKDTGKGTAHLMVATETTRDNGPWLAGGYPTVRGLDPQEEPIVGPGAPFGGLHQGGANVLWADGSVRWTSDRVQPNVFRAQVLITADAAPVLGGVP
jgi:prepilin-type processing-associated H-X9-DG protein